MSDSPLVDFAALESDLDAAAASYGAADPFPHTVIDNVLRPEVFDKAVAEFPGMKDEFWKGYLHVNETKYSNTEPDTWGPTLHDVAQEFCSPRFVAYLEKLTGISNLIPDWTMDGGGLHQTLRGGHLNIHADFTTHHTHENWARRVNILLYLNEEWPDEWGGKLELWDRNMQQCRARVTPAGNRMLVFSTAYDTFHGHPDGLTCPPDVARRSMALYYFTEEEGTIRRATNYQARPDESRARRAAIAADRTALDIYDRLKRRLGISDERVNKLLARVDRLRRRNR
ncbi:2OG-Fe(II) oxygenase [Nocardioides conyzicola]|uniref:Prolyl 4-hydroxylase alpha subunit Fe(2+) 2OG dioxygenase domain-containing protein n=1 Tax=Nocardioides conyzicola TaxID=1651781 RepID=A0ABP8Y2U4_9ACTN